MPAAQTTNYPHQALNTKGGLFCICVESRNLTSAALGPKVRVVSVVLPILVIHGLHTAAIGAVATERAGVPERPVEPVELHQAPRPRDAAAGPGVIGRAVAIGDAAVRGVDEDGPHDDVHGTGGLEAAANPGKEEDSITCRIQERSLKRERIFPTLCRVTNTYCQNR